MRTIQIFLSDLKELLESRDFTSVRSALRVISPFDLVEGWEHFDDDERMVLFKLLPRQRALQLFEELEAEHQEELLTALEDEEVHELVEDLDPTETGRIMRELAPPIVRALREILRKDDKDEEVERYLKYPDESVGALMRSNYVQLNIDWTCRKALDSIHGSTLLRQIETKFLDTLFVVDQEEMLKGTVSLKKLVVAPSATQIRELMNVDPEILSPEMDQEEAAQIFAHYKLGSAPVVDRARKLIGVVLDTDIIEVVEEETEEDIAKMFGTHADEFEEPQTAWEAARLRAPWMTVTCVGQIMVALVIWFFEVQLSRIVALATFIPLIAALGGNIGSQSAIIMVRGLSTGEIDQEGGREAVLRDFQVGLLLGLGVSVLMFCVSYAFYGSRFGALFAFVTGLGALVSMVVAATLGAMVPLMFRRVGVDPATATGPLVTTLTDIIGTASYLLLASWLLFG
ncbi:MAG: magnesium transporter [Elusimicrobiota bacterium]